MMNYQPIPEMSRADVEAAIEKNDPELQCVAVLSAALYSPDPRWTESVCLRLAEHADPQVRGNAVLGFDHLARRYGELDQKIVQPLIEAALKDPHKWVRSQAYAAADDLQHFLRWKIND